MKPGFLDKLIERLPKLSPAEVQRQVLRMARERGFLEAIFNALQEGVIVAAPDGIILYLNQAASAMFGLAPEQCVGRSLGEQVRGVDWGALFGTDGAVSREMEIYYPQNRFVSFYVVPMAFDEETGAREVRAIIVRDVTDTRRSTEETIESERLSALTFLAAGVAHEIGNPLNSLHIHLQLMERRAKRLSHAAREDFEQMVRVARDEIHRLDQIVTQFLRAIRPSVLRKEPADVNAILRESVEFLKNEIDDREVLVEEELAEGLPSMELDREQIKQAFYNIIRNSFQAMGRRGILRIASERLEDHVRLSFSDTGGGISSAQMGRMFQPYSTTKTGGSGLGLLIVRRIVREHGGEIALENREGVGLTCAILLPVRDRSVRLLAEKATG